MLQADKQVLLAGVKRNALELRQRELEFHVERYTNLATQASVVAGFSFESLVELEVPEGTNPFLSSFYFVFGSIAMALALYVLCIASFVCVFGHRLALQGPHGSLEKAVHILVEHRLHIFAAAGASLGALVCAAVLMAWIKMGLAASVVSLIFIAFGYAVATRMYLMLEVFEIPDDELVTGATRVQNPNHAGAVLDLSRLNPASRTEPASAGGRIVGGYARLGDAEGALCQQAARALSQLLGMPSAAGPDLKKYMDKRLQIKLNGNRNVQGTLRGFDQFMNLVLDETMEMVSASEQNKVGMVVIRGNSVVMIEALEKLWGE